MEKNHALFPHPLFCHCVFSMVKKPDESENNGDQNALVKFKLYSLKLHCSPASVHITDTKQV